MISLPKKKKMKKLSKILIILLILVSVLLGCVGCAGRAPKLELIYDRVVTLIEASYELNEIFYGNGLPYCDRNLPVYETLYSDYTKLGYTKNYHIVSTQARYHSVEEIKLAAEQVYSSALLQSSVYPGIFDGLMQSTPGSTSKYLPARYIQDNTDLYILIEEEGAYHPTPLIYDYASMKIVRPSNAKRVAISINAWEDDQPDRVFEMTLFLLKENDVWLLDKLTV